MTLSQLDAAYYGRWSELPYNCGDIAEILGVHGAFQELAVGSPDTSIISDLWTVMPQKYRDMDVDAFFTMLRMRL